MVPQSKKQVKKQNAPTFPAVQETGWLIQICILMGVVETGKVLSKRRTPQLLLKELLE